MARLTDAGHPVVRTTANGFVVGWTSKLVLTYPEQAFLQRIAADGARVGDQVAVSDVTSDPHEQIAVALLQDGSTLAVWRQRSFAGNNYSIFTRRFSADLTPLTAATQVPGTTASATFPVDAEALSDGNVGLAWGATAATGFPEARSAVLAPDGALALAVQATPVELPVADVAVLPFGAAGFGVAPQIVRAGSRFINASLRLRRFDLAGAPLDALTEIHARQTYWVSPTTGAFVDAGTGFDIDGGSDGHFVATFNQADESQANTYLMGR